jgi:phosphoribosylformylglycinamidine cyclo-ligase
MARLTYKDAGVDMEKGGEFADSLYTLMRRTFDGRVVANPGGFAGLFALDFDRKIWRRNYRHPLLVASTDGVGTKVKVAFMTGRHNTVGIDLVAMCVNDILVQGAEPLFFLDYLGVGKLEPEALREAVSGVAEGCRMCDCALLGGETAEMPDMYAPGEYDMAGFVVGVVERRKLITGKKIEPGDAVIGLASSGLHSNGYSLVRKLFFEQEGMKCGDSLGAFGIARTLGEELLEPTRIYVRAVRALLHRYRVKQVVHGMAHITGGGLPDNVRRILPEGCAVEMRPASWQCPRIFDVIRRLGDVPVREMYRTFNMGIGLVLVVGAYFEQSVLRRLARLGEKPALIGRVVEGDREVRIL